MRHTGNRISSSISDFAYSYGIRRGRVLRLRHPRFLFLKEILHATGKKRSLPRPPLNPFIATSASRFWRLWSSASRSVSLRAISVRVAGGQNWLSVTLQTIGTIFVQLLRALVPPLIFTAIVASIANLQNLSNAAKLVWQTLLWFAITALISVVIGIALGLIIQPGLNSSVAGNGRSCAVLFRFLARLPERSDPGQRVWPRGIDARQQRVCHDFAELQRAAAPRRFDCLWRCGSQGWQGCRTLPGVQSVAVDDCSQDSVVGPFA